MYLKAISKYKPPSPLIIKLILIYNYLGLYLEGQFNGGFFFFLRFEFGGLIFGGAYFRNFTVHNNRAKVCLMSVRCNSLDCRF